MRIRNINEEPNYGMGFDEARGDVTKGILFAVLGMLVGIAIQFLMGGVFEIRMGWIAGGLMGAAISFGYSFGKGQAGVIRQVTIVVASLVGATIGVWGGWAIYFYRSGWVRDLLAGFTVTRESFFSGASEGVLARDILIGAGVAIAVAWKAWGAKDDEYDYERDPEVLHEAENPGGLDDLPTAPNAMDDVLNQDVPTLDFDDIDINRP